MKEKEAYQRYEWLGHLMRFRNNAIILLTIICLQLPFELAYAHLYEVIESDVMRILPESHACKFKNVSQNIDDCIHVACGKMVCGADKLISHFILAYKAKSTLRHCMLWLPFPCIWLFHRNFASSASGEYPLHILLRMFGLTAVYLVIIQYFTKIGGKISVKLTQYENNENTEYQADSLVYKSYIGVFYHALLHRNFMTLRQVLVQRVIIYQVLENLFENSLPYFKYSYKKYSAVRNKKNRENGKIQFNSKVEKEYLKPTYSASVAEELEDGLFDDFLVLALQFGMIMMFACAFPLAFAFAAVNSFTEIRTDALKLLTMFKRPVPRAAATIGAWLNIFQEGKWKLEPGLAAILIMEHVLLLIKFGFSRLVPEEPAWVRANRAKNATQAQDVCSKQLLRSISGGEKAFRLKKAE
ncbi:unnamed protein product [Dovyalis caffra]|uniref:Anoctamin transmembrane domain-containing protein n=1 Tax=Dovyalis caffra TaxID=77055 RepID=A0AAV1SVG1_9ROSI|nr:unnamed protein product [Dovyalis caffra]